ncbi:MAG: anion permease, partial [Hyphomicrobiales bacterium]|nr:anion permease [Hyphomicrobiales bacterium]
VVEGFAGYGPAVLLSALFLLTAILTNFLSNQATGALMAPVAVAAAAQIGADPTPFVHGLIIALNYSFATPMAYQTNLLVMGPGHYRFADFVLGGLPLILLIWVFFSLFAPAYYGL